MRLDSKTSEIIKDEVASQLGAGAVVRLFGSRVDDKQRGGDGAQLDNLLRAEKLGWIESAQVWIEFRELGNRLVHEYMESADDLLSALQQALQGVCVLLATQLCMAVYARNMGIK